MPLAVIRDESVATGNNGGVVVVEGDSPAEVLAVESRQLALTHAVSLGISRAGISGSGYSYPVDEAGAAGDPVALANSPKGCKYRVDWKVQGGL